MTTQTTPETKLVELTINGTPIAVPKGTTVYQAAQQLKIEIPIFCYQDRMPPFGACRMCLVEVEKMGKLQTSCTLEATDGMVVKTQSQMAVEGRKTILEFLLINHPLDCPICDKGGECPLQDQALAYGPGESRFFEEKRHFTKAKPLGPVLKLDRERCIVCARCTRFGDIIAGDHALELLDRGFKTEVGTPDGRPADSKFIGNTIAICPVGALTSEVYRFRARPWDNDSTNSTCTLCPVGCSMILDSRDGEVMRTRACENRDVNDIWLCDKGWFGYEFADHPDRLKNPLIRINGELVPATWDEALSLVAKKISDFKAQGKLAALGGSPLTVEENYLFQKLMREAAGVNHLDYRIGSPIFNLEEEGIAPGMEMTIGECEKLSYALLLGLDLTEEFPVIWLRLRQAINRGAQVVFMGNFAPEIAPHLTKTILHAPGKEIETLQEQMHFIHALLQTGNSGAIFVGSQYLGSPQRRAILSELQKLRNGKNVSLNIMEGFGNSFGARYAGMRPDVGPCGEKILSPGLNAIQLIEKASQEGWDFLYVAGADPSTKFPSTVWNTLRSKLKFMVVQDIFLTETARQADVVLPSLCFVEKEGSFINIEGRVQKLKPGKEIPHGLYSDGEIFIRIARGLNISLGIDQAFSDQLKHARLPITGNNRSMTLNGVPSSSSEGALRVSFSKILFDRGVRMRHNPHVIQLAREPTARLHAKEGKKLGINDGDKIQIIHQDRSIKGKVKFDHLVAEGTIVLPLGFDHFPVQNLALYLWNGLAVQIKKEG